MIGNGLLEFSCVSFIDIAVTVYVRKRQGHRVHEIQRFSQREQRLPFFFVFGGQQAFARKIGDLADCLG